MRQSFLQPSNQQPPHEQPPHQQQSHPRNGVMPSWKDVLSEMHEEPMKTEDTSPSFQSSSMRQSFPQPSFQQPPHVQVTLCVNIANF
jgi:hypothetical protein